MLIKYVSNIYVPLYLTSFLSWFLFTLFTFPVTDYFESWGLNYNLYDFSRVFSRNKMPLQNSNLTQNLLRENKQGSKALAHKFSTYSIVEKRFSIHNNKSVPSLFERWLKLFKGHNMSDNIISGAKNDTPIITKVSPYVAERTFIGLHGNKLSSNGTINLTNNNRFIDTKNLLNTVVSGMENTNYYMNKSVIYNVQQSGMPPDIINYMYNNVFPLVARYTIDISPITDQE